MVKKDDGRSLVSVDYTNGVGHTQPSIAGDRFGSLGDVGLEKTNPFSISARNRAPLQRAVYSFALPMIERALGLDGLNDIYHSAAARPGERCFSDKVLEAMRVNFDVSDEDLARIPRTGPLLIVANHPFGGVDGIVLHALLRRVRPDVKLMVTQLLARVTEYREDFICFDNFGASGAPSRNLVPMKAAIRFVRQGGALGVFPAGEVSHRTRGNREVVDPPWSPSIARIAQVTGAAVLPIFFDGRNSSLFQFAGLIHPRLRTALLGREILRRKRSTVRLHVGSVISPRRCAEHESPEDLTSYLRTRTYILQSRCEARKPPELRMTGGGGRLEPIAPAPPIVQLCEDVARLSPDRLLLESNHLQVFFGRADELPNVLQEIGRLRELAFRAVGEGSGKKVDLDRFDQTYLHLFVWNRTQREVVGAYRMGATDEIVPAHGIDGLYTATLFRYSGELIDKISPALELGRSFVRTEYQREYSPLLLLWKGISRFIARNPKYRMLLGPVSISNDYNSLSKHLLVAFLTASRLAAEMSRWVKPRNPLRGRPTREMELNFNGAAVREVDQVDELVSEIESDRMGMPILLRQYLKLNAKLLAFNVDPDFGDVLDGLMLADLTTVNRQILNRYMGPQEAERFFAYHAGNVPTLSNLPLGSR